MGFHPKARKRVFLSRCNCERQHECPDRVYLLLSIPPSVSVSKIVQQVKGKTSRKLLEEFDALKKKRYWGQYLWARGYFAVTVGNVNSEDVQRYIEQQEEHHKRMILRSPNSERSRF